MYEECNGSRDNNGSLPRPSGIDLSDLPLKLPSVLCSPGNDNVPRQQ